MSELINTRQTNTRRHLLATVSALALAVGATETSASEDRPTVWIELGAQIERLNVDQQSFAPGFVSRYAGSSAFDPSPLDPQKLPKYGIGGEASISFAPHDTDWVFAISARYGRSNNARRVHKEAVVYETSVKYQVNPTAYPNPLTPAGLHNLNDSRATNKESHAILDFQVGKDVGLGLFGHGSTSLLNLGVRFAQFSTHSTADMRARPDIAFEPKYVPLAGGFYAPLTRYHDFHATADFARSFRGIGPSLSWQSSIPVMGHPDSAQLDIDLGLNGAVLFGRQKVSSTQHVTGYYYKIPGWLGSGYRTPTYHNPITKVSRSHSLTVPNIGGFMGISMRYPNAKVSFGYRADVFFGAVDGGGDMRKTFDRSFHGPFATISIGLGG
ncbi:MAG TPA: hypothetical protein VHD95_13105 [Rhizomicrobium sp.]|jgi:hypothetical protein|nr:hypothetical protein [Rhizomicrobium sp.]